MHQASRMYCCLVQLRELTYNIPQPISSLHPFGTLVEELGPIGDIEVETSALLKDCNFPTEDFTENVMKCLPPIPWT